MSDLGDTFKAMREASQDKRRRNRESSLKLLRERGFEPVELSESHFRIGGFDFWPTTGKYLDRENREYGRGVFNLLHDLEAEGRS